MMYVHHKLIERFSGSSKSLKAKELGVPVITETEYKTMFS